MTPAEKAIGQVADTLTEAVACFTEIVAKGGKSRAEVKQLNRLIRQFLDLRAVCVGDTAYLKAREQEEARKAEQRREMDAIAEALFESEATS